MLTLCFLVFFKIREIKPPHVFFVKILRGKGSCTSCSMMLGRHSRCSSAEHFVHLHCREDFGPGLSRNMMLDDLFSRCSSADHFIHSPLSQNERMGFPVFSTAQQRRPSKPLALLASEENFQLHRISGGLMTHWQYPDSIHDRDGPPPLLLTSLQTFFKPRAMLLATRCALLVLTSLRGLQSAQHGPISEHTRKATSTLIKQFSPAACTSAKERIET